VTLKVGFLGAGNIAHYHARLLRHSRDEFSWASVHDLDRARAEAFAAEHGASVADSPEQVVATSDVVYVVTWTSAHLPLVRMVCDAGKALFCEKPLGRDLAEAAAVVDAVQSAAIVNQVGLVLRRSPLFWLARSVVADPRSGRPMSVVFRDDQHLPVRGLYRSTWRGERDKAGSGVLLEHSIHDVDLLEWLLGPIDTVSCSTAHFHGIDGIEDVAVARFGFANGAEGSLVTLWHDLDGRISNRHVEVFCEGGYGSLEGEWYGSFRRQFGSEAEPELLEGEAMLAAAAAVSPRAGEWPDPAFLVSVREGGGAWPSVADALRPHVVVEACYRSAVKAGLPVALDDQDPDVTRAS